MKTWNPLKLVRNLFSLATVNTGQSVLYSAGFRLTAWGISLIFLGYLAWMAALVVFRQAPIDLGTLAQQTLTKVIGVVLSLRGLEGLVEDARQH